MQKNHGFAALVVAGLLSINPNPAAAGGGGLHVYDIDGSGGANVANVADVQCLLIAVLADEDAMLPACVQENLLAGDLNCDGDVNVVDAQIEILAVLDDGFPTLSSNADANKNGVHDACNVVCEDGNSCTKDVTYIGGCENLPIDEGDCNPCYAFTGDAFTGEAYTVANNNGILDSSGDTYVAACVDGGWVTNPTPANDCSFYVETSDGLELVELQPGESIMDPNFNEPIVTCLKATQCLPKDNTPQGNWACNDSNSSTFDSCNEANVCTHEPVATKQCLLGAVTKSATLATVVIDEFDEVYSWDGETLLGKCLGGKLVSVIQGGPVIDCEVLIQKAMGGQDVFPSGLLTSEQYWVVDAFGGFLLAHCPKGAECKTDIECYWPMKQICGLEGFCVDGANPDGSYSEVIGEGNLCNNDTDCETSDWGPYCVDSGQASQFGALGLCQECPGTGVFNLVDSLVCKWGLWGWGENWWPSIPSSWARSFYFWE